MSFTLQEVEAKTGRSQSVLRKHIERGKLKVSKDGGRVVVSDADLDDYISAEVLVSTAQKITETGNAPREIGNMIAKLPNRVAQAVLGGMPTSKKQVGDPELFEKATRGIPKRPRSSEESDDPHFGHPVGFEHAEGPRWKRTSKNTWGLDGATWTWNGLEWEGGGSRDGQMLGEGISPGAPASDRRPAAPPKAAK